MVRSSYCPTGYCDVFDLEYARLDTEMRQRALGMKWRGGNMMKMAMGAMGGGMTADAMPKVEPASLWPLIDVLQAQCARSMEIISSTGLRDLDPDQMPTSVMQRMGSSTIAQGTCATSSPMRGWSSSTGSASATSS